MKELKPCPFCGGVPEIRSYPSENVKGFFHHCPALIREIAVLASEHQSVVERWNTRAEVANAE